MTEDDGYEVVFAATVQGDKHEINGQIFDIADEECKGLGSNYAVTLLNEAIIVDLQGGARVWIEIVDGACKVRCYDMSNDEPVSLTLGEKTIEIDVEDYEQAVAA